ncbi:hypothetical protein A2714_03740 [Candidatus Woesebacteria bacterium RIFCSPHIGHO2_01_FULL_38_9]|uniref:Uncharacterized protein n=2 Tax=Candidatus Woeseibacteriota TaxID=1752722 RepID=A0A1F7Y0E1_9BACT|nr:MAG: hypothetical protein A2714_03740 [Candidatus Woesebacteria bacterium RIFCSPHIGHO2_01_FULL_38_9]OGM59144.1 MAG: hypothetical protein A3A75_02905 [Candidatus Woesebacteria bacterium RIFCSPLOWO2_01_FULL_39_10]
MNGDNQNTSGSDVQNIPQQTQPIQKSEDQVLKTVKNSITNEKVTETDKNYPNQLNSEAPSQTPDNNGLFTENKKSLNKVMYVGIIFMIVSVFFALALYFRQQIH